MTIFSKKDKVPDNDKPLSNEKVSRLTNIIDAVDSIFDNKHIGNTNFFESIAWSIKEITGAKTVIVGKLKFLSQEVETLAFLDDDKFITNLTYSLINTPCQTIIGKTPCSYPIDVCNQFPKDKILADLKIKAYVGIPLFYSEGKALGILTALFDHELVDFKIVESVLRIYGYRVESEIEHAEHHEMLHRQNIELNSLFIELQKKNTVLDQYIAEVEKSHNEAEESNQLKSAFLANLSHEVRTPMNVMLGFSELLKSENLTHEERIEFIDLINLNGIQLLKIMDNLIDISKFQSKRIVEHPKPVKLNRLLDEFYVEYLNNIRVLQKPIQLFLEKGLSDSVDLILSDQFGLSKILNHLLDNAVKFTHEGWVKFGYNQVGDDIVFFIKDTGVGVPMGMEDLIFDLFRQADVRASREFGGNGLGLAIARKYLEIMGGNIWLQPDPSCSSCFCFKIPYLKTTTL